MAGKVIAGSDPTTRAQHRARRDHQHDQQLPQLVQGGWPASSTMATVPSNRTARCTNTFAYYFGDSVERRPADRHGVSRMIASTASRCQCRCRRALHRQTAAGQRVLVHHHYAASGDDPDINDVLLLRRPLHQPVGHRHQRQPPATTSIRRAYDVQRHQLDQRRFHTSGLRHLRHLGLHADRCRRTAVDQPPTAPVLGFRAPGAT